MSISVQPLVRLVAGRPPRGRRRGGGAPTTAIVSLELEQNACRRAGTFRATLALDANDAAITFLLASDAAASGPPPISIDIGWLQAGAVAVWQTMFVGRVDLLTLDVPRGVLALEGRDGVGRLIDTAVSQSFQNQTSAEIVTQLAAAAGLETNVVSTGSFSGQFYQIDHARSALQAFTRFANAWDVICELAAAENYSCSVTGQTLNFVPAASTAGQQIVFDLATLVPGGGGAFGLTELRLDRRFSLEAGVQVTVRSWNSRQKTTVERSVGTGVADNATMVFVTPNATDQTALAKAGALLRDITRHRRVVSGDMAGELSLAPNDTITITNSPGSVWDGAYAVDLVTRRVSVQRGFGQGFVARSMAD